MFVLKDGSRIYGMVLAYKDGIYRVKTRYLGILQVRYITISKLVLDPQHAPPQSAGPRLRSRKQLTPQSRAPAKRLKPKDRTPEERYKMGIAQARRELRAGKVTQVKIPKGVAAVFGLDKFTESMMSGEIQSRMLDAAENDPAIRAILMDKDVQEAIAKGDYFALLKNPKLLALLISSIELKKIAREVISGKKEKQDKEKKPKPPEPK